LANVPAESRERPDPYLESFDIENLMYSKQPFGVDGKATLNGFTGFQIVTPSNRQTFQKSNTW
jgi:hypothetical protein